MRDKKFMFIFMTTDFIYICATITISWDMYL